MMLAWAQEAYNGRITQKTDHEPEIARLAQVVDQTPFLLALIDQRFGAILWYDPPDWSSIEVRWTEQERSAIQAAYALDQFIAATQALRPRE